jgi:hypothetical protein
MNGEALRDRNTHRTRSFLRENRRQLRLLEQIPEEWEGGRLRKQLRNGDRSDVLSSGWREQRDLKRGLSTLFVRGRGRSRIELRQFDKLDTRVAKDLNKRMFRRIRKRQRSSSGQIDVFSPLRRCPNAEPVQDHSVRVRANQQTRQPQRIDGYATQRAWRTFSSQRAESPPSQEAE